jgi:hypothetical protein
MRRSASPSRLFDDHLNRQHRLSYFARGPEWAFALPQGDLSALDDVMRVCAANWNGAGSVFISVAKRGRIQSGDDLLRVRPVDMVWMHRSLGDAGFWRDRAVLELPRPRTDGCTRCVGGRYPA